MSKTIELVDNLGHKVVAEYSTVGALSLEKYYPKPSPSTSTIRTPMASLSKEEAKKLATFINYHTAHCRICGGELENPNNCLCEECYEDHYPFKGEVKG